MRVLENESVALEAPEGAQSSDDERLHLVGVGARYPDKDRPKEALSQVPEDAPRLAMMHNPTSFGAFPAGTTPLAVAGHTHGGQISLPWTAEWSWVTYASKDEVHVDGWIEGFGEPGNRLYVNRGIGSSVAPIRILCPPEATLFTLRPEEVGSE